MQKRPFLDSHHGSRNSQQLGQRHAADLLALLSLNELSFSRSQLSFGTRRVGARAQFVLHEHVDGVGQHACTVHARLGHANSLLRCEQREKAIGCGDSHILASDFDGGFGLRFLRPCRAYLGFAKTQVKGFPVEKKPCGGSPNVGSVVRPQDWS